MYKTLLVLMMLTLSSTAWAQTCDLTQYKASIVSTENAGGDHTLVNGIGATGLYQFMPSTAEGLSSYQNGPSECKPAGIDGVGLASGLPQCNALQEAMMDEFTMRNLVTIRNNTNCLARIEEMIASGEQVTGYKYTNSGNPIPSGQQVGQCTGPSCSCPVTWSGILGGAHLGGAGGICNTLLTGRDVDDGSPNDPARHGTSRLYYVCAHGGFPVPDTDCTPQSYNTSGGTIQPGTFTDGWQGVVPPPARGNPDEFLLYYWVGGLQLMANQLTAVMTQQVFAIGKLFDAKHQLETQRLLQQKYARAHKDYHPSEQMCEIGTFSRDLLNAETRAKLTETAITEKLMARGLAGGEGLTQEGNTTDRRSRLKQYIETFCSIEDNAENNSLLCDSTSGDDDQQNMDIDFTRLIDTPLTLDIDLTAAGSSTPAEIREEKTETNLFAFLNYIFMHDALPTTGRAKTTLEKFMMPYQDARSLMAMRSIAHNSFAHLIAMKTAGPKTPAGGSGAETTAPFLRALMREMGMGDDEMLEFLGENPSYYAQMEILTKKIYQNPEFVTNLYDKPANIRRIRAAMNAIKLMQDRDIHEALMRREMLISMILELKLREKQEKLGNEINNSIGVPVLEGRPLTP